MTNDKYAEELAKTMGWRLRETIRCLAGDEVENCLEVAVGECRLKKSGRLDGYNECIRIGSASKDREYYKNNIFVMDACEFNPATDWKWAGMWIEWLMNNWYRVEFSPENVCSITASISISDDIVFVCHADTPLEALKAASVKFIEARHE